MANGKQRIREAALALFNERGYDAVSLRDVAREAGVAIGTLTYHYKRKEDLLEDLLADLHSGFEARLDESLSGEDLLGHLLDLFVDNEANQARYPFYFHNLTQIALCSPALAEEERRFEERLRNYYRKTLNRLAEDGIVRTPLLPDSLDAIAYAFVTLQATWSVGGSPYANGVGSTPSISAVLAGMLAPILSDGALPAYGEACSARGILLSR